MHPFELQVRRFQGGGILHTNRLKVCHVPPDSILAVANALQRGSKPSWAIRARTGGAVCNVSYWHVGVQDGFDGHRASKLCSNLILMTAPWRLFRSWDGCVLPYPCLVLGRNTVLGDAGSSPGNSRGGMPKYDPTTKLIILHRSPKTLLWDSCGLNLHTNTVYKRNNKI
jgi:hypothetical protein